MEKKVRKKRKLGSYPFVSVVFSVTMALFVIGIFGLFFIHAKKLTNLIQENIELQVFLGKKVSDNEIEKVQRLISAKPYVLTRDGKPAIRLVTKEEAAAKFAEDTGEDFTQFLGDNPLRDALIINIKAEYQASDSLRNISQEIDRMGSVYEVSYVESLVESINKNLTKIGLILLGFFVILLMVIVILINNTIKLALFSQRFLIRSMQLVGATSGFIRKPFLLRSVWYGLLAGLLAVGLLWLVMWYANQKIEDLDQLKDINYLIALFASLVAIGVIVAFLSTYRAIRKYLKMSLDELY